ncbi:MAG: efflux RND transporter permease subunit, partial [Gammaproteobacteria bacterium]|nr:efflux RND transporter permease subunit [Gammaproteobacteria bacterium]
MNPTRLSLSNPVAVFVAVLLTVLFGVISLSRLPIQLTPDIEEPEITIRQDWRAAAPEEVEAELVEPQEEVFRGTPGVTKILSKARRGQSEITLTFDIDTELQRNLLEVLNRLNRVASFPEDADEPVISAVGGDARPIAWFIMKTAPGNPAAIDSYQDFIEEVAQARIERVPGVAQSQVYGGRDTEIRVTFDPYLAANLGVELPRASRLAGSGRDVSGGFTDVGKRRYTIRFAGKYPVRELEEMVIEWRDGRLIQLRDVARVDMRLVDRESFVINNATPSVAVNASREQGVNVLQVMAGLRTAIEELRAGPLKRAGLTIEQVYDETLYIEGSIEMLRTNLALGILLAVGVLWWFFRKFRATLMVAVAIPMSLMLAFMLMDALGRTLNVVSLAGLAFAVGMVLDAGIVVLENVMRLREGGESPQRASEHGAIQVWGALLASTATTVAIFLPVVFLKNEIGQLFGDLALAISAAVVASLIIALTVTPTAAAVFIRSGAIKDPHRGWWDSGTRFIMAITATAPLRWLWVVVLLSVPLAITYLFVPKADYLPEGNRNLVFAFVLPPPGSSIDYVEKEMGQILAARLAPYMSGEKQPQVKNYFFVSFFRGTFMGARTEDPDRTAELVGVVNEVLRGFPDTIAIAKRASLFGGLSGGNAVEVDIQSRDVSALLKGALAGLGASFGGLPGSQVRPLPGVVMAEPELRLIPNERRIAEAGWDRGTISAVTRALGDGLFVGDYFDGEQKRDIILRAEPWSTPEELAAIPLATPNSGIVPFGELVEVTRTVGPNEIRRVNRRRTVTLQVTPPPGMPLETAIATLKQNVAPAIQSALPEDGVISYSGSADKLDIAIRTMGGTFLLAVVILYLLMSALFRSFRDSLLVIMVLPLATVGGVIALWGVNRFVPQAMDLLTMIGFIILLGLVVNNAILLVHQTRS